MDVKKKKKMGIAVAEREEGGSRWSKGKPLRMAVLPDTGSDKECKAKNCKDWRRRRNQC